MFKNLEWISVFQSDRARLIALAVIAFATIVIACAKPISQAWLADRKDRRRFELERMKLVDELGNRIEQRKRERLNLEP